MLERTTWGALGMILACCLIPVPFAHAQSERSLPWRRVSAPPAPRGAANQILRTHKFWDRTNLELFSGVAAVRALDYVSTRHFRDRGANEVLLSNAIVDNKPLFAGIEAASTAASLGVSYFFHRKGHHRIERWVSIVHIGVGGFGDARNFTLGKSQPGP